MIVRTQIKPSEYHDSVSLMLVAITPFAGGAAVRAARS